MKNEILKNLNPAQRKAAEVLFGPMLILAGAGSGKTRTLTYRIANLIANDVDSSAILAVTFTNKAAGEMRERLDALLPNAKTPSVGTFHSICVRILRAEIEKADLGFSRNFVIFDTGDSQSLMKIIIKEKKFDTTEVKFRKVLSHVSASKNALKSVDEYFSKNNRTPFQVAAKECAKEYEKRLREHNALDFDDLLGKTVQVFEKDLSVLQKYRNRWNHICVDEYQDTNFVQYRLVRLLADEHQNLCVIGDDAQSIYAFRGADFQNILNFEKDFPGSKIFTLEQNYRSTGNILHNANKLIAHNKTGRPKKLWTQNEPGEAISVTDVTDEKEEGNFIAKKIRELRDDEQIKFSDVAILYRMNAQSRAIEEALLRAQIPYQIVGGTRFFDRKEIKDVIAYLRIIFNARDDVAFLRIINFPSRKLGAATIGILREYAINYTMSFFEILEKIDDIEEIADSKKIVLKKFRDQILKFKKIIEDEPVSFLINKVIDEFKIQEALEDGSSEGESRVQNIRELLSVAGRYDGAENSIAAFLEGVALISDLDNLNKNTDAITLMTIHASKGLEFPIVFLPGWEDGIFPSSNSQFLPENLEEERRLAYVAITRAEKFCFITNARSRMLFGKTEGAIPSRFISELDDEAVNRISQVSENSEFSSRKFSHSSSFASRKTTFTKPSYASEKPKFSKSEIFTSPPKNKKEAIFGITENETGYKSGERVRHNSYGDGTVIRIDGDVLSVAFAGRGMEKLVASVTPLEKIDL
jgi:DNA helicase-2/ATP-dependent DNA helicase PcrA